MSDLSGNSVNTYTEAIPIQEGPFIVGPDPDSGQSDFRFYRSAGVSPLDPSPQLQERTQIVALNLYRTNPLAHRLVKLIAAFAVGGVIRFEAENPRIQKILVDHWQHPLNNWERMFPQCGLELGLYGEVFALANVMDDGDVTWGHIDPLRIKKVTPDERDLARAGQVHIVLHPLSGGTQSPTGIPAGVASGQTTPFDVINYDGKPNSPTKGLRVGQVLFERTNGVRGSLRGLSDLFPLADYIDGLDQFMFALQQRVSHQNNWIWDVTLEGQSEAGIRDWLSSVQGKPPKPGAIRAHNERVTWLPLTPSHGATDAADHVKIFRSYVMGGAGLADWILGDMQSSNRASTESSAAVIMRTMEQRQREVKGMLEDIFNFVIDQKIIAGAIPTKRGFNRKFYVTMPKVGIRDFQRVAAALNQGANGITTLLQNGLIDNERAQSIAGQLLNQLDLEGSDRFNSKSLVSEEENESSYSTGRYP